LGLFVTPGSQEQRDLDGTKFAFTHYLAYRSIEITQILLTGKVVGLQISHNMNALNFWILLWMTTDEKRTISKAFPKSLKGFSPNVIRFSLISRFATISG